ncbi:MAG: hypothetical protein CSA68_07500 [Rhodobacterales bacterium]|nr:MAG: hypothetical protein CSA68_07500 [Rhodobacterales bacterium]
MNIILIMVNIIAVAIIFRLWTRAHEKAARTDPWSKTTAVCYGICALAILAPLLLFDFAYWGGPPPR